MGTIQAEIRFTQIDDIVQMYTELEKSYLEKSFLAIAQSTEGDIVDEVFMKCDQVAKRVSFALC